MKIKKIKKIKCIYPKTHFPINKSGMSIPYCIVCKKEFEKEMDLAIHLDKHTKNELINILRKYRNNYN